MRWRIKMEVGCSRVVKRYTAFVLSCAHLLLQYLTAMLHFVFLTWFVFRPVVFFCGMRWTWIVLVVLWFAIAPFAA